jgi:hypothetical protein
MASKPSTARQVVNLSDLNLTVAKRGRKSTVTPDDIVAAQSLAVGQGIEIEEYNLNGPEFAAYYAEKIGTYGDHPDPDAALLNAWTSRYRQRIMALAKASGVALAAVLTNDGRLFAGRKS